jgi:HK97 family phage portal protein
VSVIGNIYSFFRGLWVGTPTSNPQGGRSDAGETVEELDVLALSTAWACLKLMSGTIASLPISVYRPGTGGHDVVDTAHPLYRLLHRSPNPEQTVVDFWEGAVASIELKGNAVALKQRNVRGEVIALQPMAWDYISVTRRTDTDELEYEYRGKKYAAVDVLHIRGFGGSPLGGLSTIAMGVATFGMAKAINRTAAKTFANGIRSAGILTKEGQPFQGTQRADAERLLREKYTGAMNAGVPMLLDNGLKWESLSINPDDAQMLESRAFSVEEVCRMFGVPPHMVGHTEKTSSWGTGIEQMTLAFVKFSLRSRIKRIETALEQQLLTPDDIAKGVSIQFNLEGLLRGDSTARSSFYQSALMNGWMTINEVRALEGLAPVAGGEVPRMQMQNVPITDAGKTVAAPVTA